MKKQFFKGLRNALAIFALSLFVIISGTLFFSKSSYAFFGGLPFGGKVMVNMLCSNGYLVTILGAKGGKFLYQPGISQLYKFYLPYIGENVIGTAYPGGICYLPPPLAPIPAKGTIRMIGTSALWF